jgi:CDP-glucose 4,6-dehydratase
VGLKPGSLEMLVTDGFWRSRRVLVTGHTGFKGAWLAFWLAALGADVSGLALRPATDPNLHDLLDVPKMGRFVHADINDRRALASLMSESRPEVVFHLAAQALVRPSYEEPVETFATNSLGTVTLLDAVRNCPDVRATIIVTSDKAYENREWPWGYRETDALGGYDPYSASKGCAEIATASMRRSFFGPGRHPGRIATARAGNVIGGGDWSPYRLAPDIVRGCLGADGEVRLRNPNAVRPWQHVLDPLGAYMLLAEKLCDASTMLDEAWNFGPDDSQSRSVLEVARALVAALGRGKVVVASESSDQHEAGVLALDCSKARSRLGWRPHFNFESGVAMTADWYRAWVGGDDMTAVTRSQIAAYMKLLK